jgi:archaellum component FlaC
MALVRQMSEREKYTHSLHNFSHSLQNQNEQGRMEAINNMLDEYDDVKDQMGKYMGEFNKLLTQLERLTKNVGSQDHAAEAMANELFQKIQSLSKIKIPTEQIRNLGRATGMSTPRKLKSFDEFKLVCRGHDYKTCSCHYCKKVKKDSEVWIKPEQERDQEINEKDMDDLSLTYDVLSKQLNMVVELNGVHFILNRPHRNRKHEQALGKTSRKYTQRLKLVDDLSELCTVLNMSKDFYIAKSTIGITFNSEAALLAQTAILRA